jgi:hypothetical protein
MSKPQPQPWRIYVTILAGLGWLVALALWLFFYAGNFSILQNIGIFILSVALIGIIVILLWLPWSFKHRD